MSIQGIGQSFAAYQPMNMRGMQGTNGSFDPSDIAGKIMEKEDANLDGVLSADETQMSGDMFSNADTDADGQLTTKELEEMLSNGPPKMGSGKGGMGMMGGMGGMGQFDVQSILEQEDTDEDGSISTEETSLPDRLFSKLDTDQDGQISQEELEKGIYNKQENMGNMQGLSSNQTVTNDQAINAYQQAIESFMTKYTKGEYTDSNLSNFLELMA